MDILALAVGFALLVGAIRYLIRDRQRRHELMLASMTPEQRDFYEADREYKASVRQSEKELRDATNAYERGVRFARTRLKEAREQGQRQLRSYLGRNGRVQLFVDRIETPHGVARFESGPVKASVQSSGTLMVRKDQTLDTRELYLRINTTGFSSVVQCNPNDGPKVQLLVAEIENAALAAPRVKAAARQAVAQAEHDLRVVESDRHAVTTAERRVEATKANTGRLDAARAALPESVEMPALVPAERRGLLLASGAIALGGLLSWLALTGAVPYSVLPPGMRTALLAAAVLFGFVFFRRHMKAEEEGQRHEQSIPESIKAQRGQTVGQIDGAKSPSPPLAENPNATVSRLVVPAVEDEEEHKIPGFPEDLGIQYKRLRQEEQPTEQIASGYHDRLAKEGTSPPNDTYSFASFSVRDYLESHAGTVVGAVTVTSDRRMLAISVDGDEVLVGEDRSSAVTTSEIWGFLRDVRDYRVKIGLQPLGETLLVVRGRCTKQAVELASLAQILMITYDELADLDVRLDESPLANIRLALAKRKDELAIRRLYKITGWEFEERLAEYFAQRGYHAKATKGSGDQGVDVLLTKDGYTVVVQAKLWQGPVSNKAVQEVYAGMAHYNAQEAWVVTPSSFTESAKALARTTGVRLLTIRELDGYTETLPA